MRTTDTLSTRSTTAKDKELKRLDWKLGAESLKLVEKASKDFYPVRNIADMDVRVIVAFLLTLPPAKKSKSKSKGQKYLSRSGCGNYRSALNELFRECDVERPQTFSTGLS